MTIQEVEGRYYLCDLNVKPIRGNYEQGSAGDYMFECVTEEWLEALTTCKKMNTIATESEYWQGLQNMELKEGVEFDIRRYNVAHLCDSSMFDSILNGTDIHEVTSSPVERLPTLYCIKPRPKKETKSDAMEFAKWLNMSGFVGGLYTTRFMDKFGKTFCIEELYLSFKNKNNTQ